MKTTFIPRDIIGRILLSVTGTMGEFKPKREFYDHVNIKQKRFHQLVRGDVAPTTDEIEAVARYFNKKLELDIPLVQLSLFDNTGTIYKTEK